MKSLQKHSVKKQAKFEKVVKSRKQLSLNTLNAIQRRAIRLIGDPAALTDTLDSLAHRRSVFISILHLGRIGFAFLTFRLLMVTSAEDLK